MNYLRYSPDIEQPERNEDDAIDGIITAMTRQSQRVAKREGHAVRAPHAKSTASSVARNVNRAAKALGSDIPVADFFGHPFCHPLAEPYFSQAPMRYGDYVAEIGVFAADPKLESLKKHRVDTSDDDNAFRTAVVDHFAKHGAHFELRVQLWTNADTQPIEDASIAWPQEESPFRTVAWLDIPAQNAYSPARQRYFDEWLTFAPAHALAAHQPLGSVMRARLKVYAALSEFRHGENDTTPETPTDSDDIPE